jgi:hypothetical protein
MKRYALLACVALAACAPADDQPAADSAPAPAVAVPDTASINNGIRATIDRYYEGFKAGNAEQVDSVLNANAVYVHGNGAVSRKEEPLGHIRAGKLTIQQVDYDIVDIRTFGDDFALVDMDHRSQGSIHGMAWPPSAVTFGLARTGGGPWEIVYLQAVPKMP